MRTWSVEFPKLTQSAACLGIAGVLIAVCIAALPGSGLIWPRLELVWFSITLIIYALAVLVATPKTAAVVSAAFAPCFYTLVMMEFLSHPLIVESQSGVPSLGIIGIFVALVTINGLLERVPSKAWSEER